MLKALELSDADFRVLKNYCREINIGFLSTPSDVPSLELLCRLELKILKISSGDIINIPLLRKAGSLGKNIILSTGMSTLAEVQKAVDELITAGTPKEKITLLHCHSAYPTRFEDANLSVMRTLRETFGTKVGLSDHTEGAELSIAAVALGASVIEKHLTLDRNMEGPDQKMSTEPGPFAEIVKAVRNTEKAMGDGIKRITEAEAEIRKVYGKGIVALKPVVTGEIFSENNVTVKRPCHGLSVRDWDKVLGRKASRNFKKDEFITL
jgi:N,N'-diacetyllegionaminate synthase